MRIQLSKISFCFRIGFVILSGLFLLGCGNITPPTLKSLLEYQPTVIEINPPDGSTLQDPIAIVVKFSNRIDIQRLDGKSIALLKGVADPKLFEDSQALIAGLSSDKLDTLPLQTNLDGDEKTLTLVPTTELTPDVYHLVVTPSLISVDGLPFNQKPGDKPTTFMATFAYGDGVTVDAGVAVDPSTGTPVSSFGPIPQSLVINEMLYDGKESETDGEAFVELYGTPRADISLYQISFVNGADGQQIDRVTLPMGTILSENGIFVSADLRTNSTTTTKVQNYNFLDQFDPQNGPDAVQLFDRDSKLLDALTYGTGAVELSADGFPLLEGIPALDVGAGHSLSRVDGVDTNDNSVDFVDLTVPTPGIL